MPIVMACCSIVRLTKLYTPSLLRQMWALSNHSRSLSSHSMSRTKNGPTLSLISYLMRRNSYKSCELCSSIGSFDSILGKILLTITLNIVPPWLQLLTLLNLWPMRSRVAVSCPRYPAGGCSRCTTHLGQVRPSFSPARPYRGCESSWLPSVGMGVMGFGGLWDSRSSGDLPSF